MEINFYYIMPGAFVFVFGVFNLYRVFSKRAWPTAIGRIQRHEVKEQESSIFNPLRLDPNSGYSLKSILGTNRENVLGLSYVFVVDKYKYVSSQLYSAPIIQARQKIGGLNIGDKVHVFYKPGNPHSSFLAQSFAWPSFVVSLVGLLLIGIGFYLQAKS